MLKYTTHITKAVDNPASNASVPIIKSRQGKWLVYVVKSLNPFNWFNDFSCIEITLEEFSTGRNT